MGFRFRRTIKLLPGLRLNLSRSGITASVGKPGATLNVGGKAGPRATVGIPGTGLSYSERMGAPSEHETTPADPPQAGIGLWRVLGWGLAAYLAYNALAALLA